MSLEESASRGRLSRFVGTPRRAVTAGAVVAAVVAAVAVGVTDPFAGAKPAAGSSDNSFPTSTTTVTRQSLSEQTDVSGTIGYSGSYSVMIPSGTAAAAVTQAESTVSTDEAKLHTDEAALTQAKRLEPASFGTTFRDARATVDSDSTALSEADSQLSSDEALGCPTSSSITVTSPVSSSGTGNNGLSGTGTTGSTSPSGNTGKSDGTEQGDTGVAAAPQASGDTATATASATSEALSGSVTPNGLATTYYFEWGKTSAFGSTTGTESAGSGFDPVPVSATISDLSPNETYQFALVATNSLGTAVGATVIFQTASSSCVAERQVITEDTTALSDAKDALRTDELGKSATVDADEATVASDEQTLSTDEAALSSARSEDTNPGSHFTALPQVGQKITRGQSVYSLDGHPVPLFYGTTIAYRALYLGVSNGPDVAELQENLIALGFGAGVTANGDFSVGTEAAVEAWQRSIGVPATGQVDLGDVVVEPSALIVTAVSATLGQPAQPAGAVLSASSTDDIVTIPLDANLAPDVKAGDRVQITLPDGSVVPGSVTSVGTVATTPSGAGNTGATPTVTVLVSLDRAISSGSVDQATVEVAITTASVSNVLAVPVDALLALSGGGYAVEEVFPTGAHQLVAVSLGLFDDAAGTVQVSGSGLVVGQKVVIPQL